MSKKHASLDIHARDRWVAQEQAKVRRSWKRAFIQMLWMSRYSETLAQVEHAIRNGQMEMRGEA